jgi:hypothetical protein
MSHARNFPAGNAVAGQHGGQDEIDDVGFSGAETARRGYDRDLILVTQQEQVTWLHGSEKTLQLTPDAGHGAADHILRTRWGSGGAH